MIFKTWTVVQSFMDGCYSIFGTTGTTKASNTLHQFVFVLQVKVHCAV